MKKQKIGIVIRNSLEKTTVVVIRTRYQHPKYLKTLIRTKKYLVHDEQNISKIGDIALIEQSAPISKRKKWQLLRIVSTIK